MKFMLSLGVFFLSMLSRVPVALVESWGILEHFFYLPPLLFVKTHACYAVLTVSLVSLSLLRGVFAERRFIHGPPPAWTTTRHNI